MGMAAEPGTRRRRRAPGGRLARTIVLAAAALAAVLYGLQENLELDRAELWSYLGLSLLWILVPFAAALTVFGVWLALRWLLSRVRSAKGD